MGRLPPRGIWGVADALQDPGQARAWAEHAALAAAWSFRRPCAPDRTALAALRALAAARRDGWLAVHGRADLAAVAGADAVIAGYASLPPAQLRRVAPAAALGVSTHSLEELAAARAAGAGFVLFGPVWDTPAKHGLLEARGIEALAAACGHGLPVVAIGGIGEARQVEACRAAGAHGAAVLRAAQDPHRLADLVAAWDG